MIGARERPERPQPPAPEVLARTATDDEAPRSARTLARKARGAGWTVRVVYSRGPDVTQGRGWTGRVVDAVTVRMSRGGERVVACYVAGKFESSPYVAEDGELAVLGYRDLTERVVAGATV